MDGDPGPASPGLDAARLLIRGSGVEGATLDETLANAGLTREQRDAVTRDHPELVTTYHLVEEVQPRVNYLKFLDDNDRLGGESVASCIVRQEGRPSSLVRSSFFFSLNSYASTRHRFKFQDLVSPPYTSADCIHRHVYTEVIINPLSRVNKRTSERVSTTVSCGSRSPWSETFPSCTSATTSRRGP